jgi:hypothetical protein
MQRALCAAILTLGAAGAMAGQGGNCSPEGTWYGYNDQGYVWIVTISRSGPSSFTTVMDWGANLNEPWMAGSTDWRGEMVKTGPRSYEWTTMALYSTGDPTLPFVLGLCPVTAEFTSCDSWEGAGTCSYYGYSSPEQDPFEVGIWVGDGPVHAFFNRMPMSYPE